ncbi:uncharacterized protein LOC127838529 [Dreissena polymorpha]|uniref:EGF-like domain-containing protein n=1 Tax=Dreissena polymorpha TaxID=45954 RepID=A0A9D4FG06_DREPO|nr:uncharacterized protein LOC127838529 [Dreissena polymorpha]XP_052222288.1 uncharacterized protein LOC127838529 [Dreissena polymorpha]KAH3798354.1 hypothetical protein DPMN_151953 [Dreissena polymorpha]
MNSRMYITFLVLISLAETFASVCSRCLNNSTCRTVTSEHVTMNTCVCRHGYFGSRCESHVKLMMSAYSDESVTLQVELIYRSFAGKEETLLESKTKRPGVNTFVPDVSDPIDDIGISVHYWPADKSGSCNIQPIRITPDDHVTIYGLRAQTAYNLCPQVGHQDWCIRTLDEHSDSNCVTIVTKQKHIFLNTALLYTIIAGSIAVVGLVILVIIFIIAWRSRYFSQLICIKRKRQTFRQRRNKRRKAKKSEIQMTNLFNGASSHSFVEAYQIPETDNLATGLLNPELSRTPGSGMNGHGINIHAPKSPGKPLHQLVQNMSRGYVEYSAANEQAIPLSAVINYGEGPDDLQYSPYSSYDDLT